MQTQNRQRANQTQQLNMNLEIITFLTIRKLRFFKNFVCISLAFFTFIFTVIIYTHSNFS